MPAAPYPERGGPARMREIAVKPPSESTPLNPVTTGAILEMRDGSVNSSRREGNRPQSELFDLLDLTVTAIAAASSSGLVKRMIAVSFSSLPRGKTTSFLT